MKSCQFSTQKRAPLHLLGMPTVLDVSIRKLTIHDSYIKRVNLSMTKLDPLLKTLQVRASPPEGLVQAYLIHIGDRSDANFRKVLELKGLRKAEHASLVELFHAHRAAQDDNLVASSPLLTPLNLHASTTTGSGSALPALQTRFDPSTFGSALMSVARDGVDRLGTPALPGGSSSNSTPPLNMVSPSAGPRPPPANLTGGIGSAAGGTTTGTTAGGSGGGDGNSTTNLNENLRNIGKFFRRDMSGFGGRFGGGGGGLSRQASDDAR